VARCVANIAAVILVSRLAGPSTAAAATSVTNFSALSNVFAAGGEIALGDNIPHTGEALDVGAGQTVTTLRLPNGRTIHATKTLRR
jgi:hypothetical protein